MSTAFAVARDVFAVIGMISTVGFAVLFGVSFTRDRQVRRFFREEARRHGRA